MKLKEWGEENFIDFLKSQFSSPSQEIGIGDDCAVLPYKDGYQLITTDAMVEDIHFIKDHISPENLGFKIVAANVSDIAAMGGKPEHAFLTLALPKTLDTLWLKNFVKGIKIACERFEINLLGGDTVGSKKSIFINLALIGSARNIKLRNAAKVDDVIFVTSFLGDSLAGLQLLKIASAMRFPQLVEAHATPEVYPEQGQWLASKTDVHAMMDISDGLDSDLKKLLKASNCGASINLEKLPISNSLKKACRMMDWNPIEMAVTGGEDYCLLGTASANEFSRLAKEFERKFASQVHPIGQVTRQGLEYVENGQHQNIKVKTFNHF